MFQKWLKQCLHDEELMFEHWRQHCCSINTCSRCFYPWTHLMATLILVATITLTVIRFTAGFILSVCNHYIFFTLVITFCEQQWEEGWWSSWRKLNLSLNYCSGLYNLRETTFQNKKKTVFSHLNVEYFII